MRDDSVTGNESMKHSGRPRKHESDKARVQAWRKEKRASGRRLDCFINDQASWRLSLLAQSWDCSISGAVERLILEADTKYPDILFPAEKEQE
jgi:hypothetical protein